MKQSYGLLTFALITFLGASPLMAEDQVKEVDKKTAAQLLKKYRLPGDFSKNDRAKEVDKKLKARISDAQKEQDSKKKPDRDRSDNKHRLDKDHFDGRDRSNDRMSDKANHNRPRGDVAD